MKTTKTNIKYEQLTDREGFIDETSDCKFRCILFLILENWIQQLITRINELYDLKLFIFNYTFNTNKLNVLCLVNTSITVIYTQKMRKILFIFYVHIPHLLH